MWWKLLAGAAAVALAGFLIKLYGGSQYKQGQLAERVAWKDVSLDYEKKIGALNVANEHRIVTATENYAARVAAIQPIVLHSTETVTRYAQTPAGRAFCLAPDRVHGIEQDRSVLFPGYPEPALEPARAVPANADSNR